MKLLYRLLTYFYLMAPAMFFSATVVVPEVSPGTEGGEVEGGESEETVEGEESVEEGQEEAEESTEVEGKVTPKVEAKVDWKTIPPEVKAHIQEIAKANPKLGNLLQNAVYTSQTFLREFPGGLKEAKGLKQSIDEAGGLDEIKNLQTSHKTMVDEQENLDRRAAAGDPGVLDVLAEVAGEGFVKLMEPALVLWNKKDAPGYAHTMAKLLSGTLSDGGVISSLNLVHKMLALNSPEATKVAIDELKKACDYINSIGEAASKTPERPKVDPGIAAQQKEIEDGRAKLFNDKFASRFSSWRNPQITNEIHRVAPKGRTFSQAQLNVIGQEVVKEMKGILVSDPEYVRNLERLYNTRNEEELFKFCQSRNLKLLPSVTKKVYNRLYRDIGGTKKKAVVPGTDQKGTQRVVATTDKGTKGWVKISADKAPTPDEIDNKATDFNMKFKKQAILKTGQKVFWGDRVPA